MESPTLTNSVELKESKESLGILSSKSHQMKKQIQQSYPFLPWNWFYPYYLGGLHPSRVGYSSLSSPSDVPRGHSHASPVLPFPVNGLSNSVMSMWTSRRKSHKINKFTIDEILGRDSPEIGEKPTDLSVTRRDSAEEVCEEERAGSAEESSQLEDYSWLQCTRYRPPKLPRIKRKDGVKKRKLGRNPRIPFTQHQVSSLEEKFRHTHYLSSVDVAELSAQLNLTETRVKIWFQNRRARERRDRESRKDLLSSTSREVRWPVPPVTVPSLPPATTAFPRPSPLGGVLCGGFSAFSPVIRNHDKHSEMDT